MWTPDLHCPKFQDVGHTFITIVFQDFKLSILIFENSIPCKKGGKLKFCADTTPLS